MRATHPELRFLWRLVARHRLALLASAVLLAVASVALLAMPWFVASTLREIDRGEIPIALLLAWLGLLAAQSAVSYASSVLLIRTNAEAVTDLGGQLYDHVQSLPVRWHQERMRGETLALLTNDVARVSGFLTGMLAPLLPLVLTCAGAAVLLVRIEPGLGVAIAIAVPLLVLALKLATRSMRPLAEAGLREHAVRYGIVEQNLSQLWLIKAFARERHESARYADQGAKVRDLEVRQARIAAALIPGVRFAGAAVVIGLLWFGGRELASGRLASPDLVSLVLYGLLLTQPVSQLANVYGQLQLARGAARRLIAALEEKPEPDTGTARPEKLSGAISFESVTFSYPGRPPLLTGLDLAIRPGETVAIVGANGSGKSTLAHLLLRFMDPLQGRITLDGVDLREYPLPFLREAIGIVSQNVMLFNATVRDNIAYGALSATEKETHRAAHAANAHDFIAALPEGYDTCIGDDGIRLSGGQKQRIALARALLKDPPVLILDEATAMFDPEGERELIDGSYDLLRARTVLLITHRPASLALADRVLHLQDGKLREANFATSSMTPS